MNLKPLIISIFIPIAAINSAYAGSFSGLNKTPLNNLSISTTSFASAGQLATLDGIPAEAMALGEMERVEGKFFGFGDIFSSWVNYFSDFKVIYRPVYEPFIAPIQKAGKSLGWW